MSINWEYERQCQVQVRQEQYKDEPSTWRGAVQSVPVTMVHLGGLLYIRLSASQYTVLTCPVLEADQDLT